VRSPVAVGIVLGLVVGGGAAAAIAATSHEEGPRSSAPHRVAAPQSTTDPAPGSIERVAAAFDLHGPVEADAGGWVVRDGDRLLRVQRAGGLPWFFSTAAKGPLCVVVPDGPQSSEPLQTVPPSGPEECPEEQRPGDVLPKDDAMSLGTDTLRRAGLGAAATDIVDQPGGWYIQAQPQIHGDAAGLPWTISIGPGRTISAASGSLAVEDR